MSGTWPVPAWRCSTPSSPGSRGRYPLGVALRLYDTGTRSVRDFIPKSPGQAGIYLCGLTVQSGPHIGHLRSGVNYDVLRRWLEHSGYQVRFVRNITDIDDKVLAKALEQERPFWSIAYENELVLARAYRTLGVLPPTYEPRATGHIPEMHELIKRLIESGHAYVADDGSGDVYFDVRSYPDYGALSGQRVDAMEAAADAPERAKRDPRDFALWKGEKKDEPADAFWPSPWGPGRPGWHIECSAMCWRYLGDEFDIHGGGLDLVFPHHENEIAQSRAAGLGVARYWVHHALLNLGTAKMSKSIGNVIDLEAIPALGRSRRRQPAVHSGRSGGAGPRTARGGAAAQGLGRRRRDPRPTQTRRRDRRGHPARTPMERFGCQVTPSAAARGGPPRRRGRWSAPAGYAGRA